ncbi:carbohydrate ABC transporter permease [Kribbella sp. CA-294648]|uniref:carbohydrate ABC transporter permease n=1 Tax=Kribbella sp. CA-294648 TaxID=3239948 RepID=UPI003D91AA49
MTMVPERRRNPARQRSRPKGAVPSPGTRRRHGLRQPLEHLVLAALALLVLVPFIWLASVAFRSRDDLYRLFPSRLTLENFAIMVDRVPDMVGYYLNSVLITVGAVLVVAVASTMAGYAFSQLSFRGRDQIFWILIATIFVPHATVVATLYLQLFELGLLDTQVGLILVYASWQLPIGTLVMRSVFSQVPDELQQSAKVDGASTWQIMWRIYVPIGKGGMIIACLMAFVHFWGEFLLAFTLAGTKVIPMSIGIRFFEPSPSDPDFSFAAAAAAALVMFIPSVIVYVGFQKWFSRGVMEGAIKG